MFARHGFQNVAERLKLGRHVLSKSSADIDKLTVEERVRLSFEQLGPTFVKLGQLLSTRPDLIPQEFVDEFKKLRSDVRTLDFSEVKPALEDHFGKDLGDIFELFDDVPLASGSIAQVHKAYLKSGEEVVVKIQRPGIVETINEDLGVLYQLAMLVESYVPELKVYDPVAIIDEFFRTLQLETNFIVEANNLRRFEESFSDDEDIKVPKVYMQLCGEKVLVMESLQGKPLSRCSQAELKELDRDRMIEAGLRCYFDMVFRNGFFHGDLHSGNFFVLDDGKIGLIDFGIVGRLNRRTQDAIINMLIGMAIEDYERVAYEYVDLAPYNEDVDVEVFAKDLRDLISPYYGLTMKNVNVGKLLMDTSSIAARHKLRVPTELMLYFKSMIGIESVGRELIPDFDFLDHAIAFSKELAKTRFEPKKIIKEFTDVAQDTKNLAYDLPRQLRQILRRVNSPSYTPKFSIEGSEEINRTVSNFGDLTFMGLLIGGLMISGSLSLSYETKIHILGLPLISAIFFIMAAFYGFLAFYKYLKK